MKKELFALLLLVLLLAVSAVNYYILRGIVGDIYSELDGVTNADPELAENAALRAKAVWDANSPYLHIVLHHDRIESTTDDFYALLSAIRAGDGTAVEASERVKERLKSISDLEKISLGSVL